MRLLIMYYNNLELITHYSNKTQPEPQKILLIN